MLNEEESKALTDLREKSGLSASALFRKFLFGEPIRERPNADFIKLTEEINDIGVNFNQLVHKANTAGFVTQEDLKETQRYFERILLKLRSWEKTWR
jgi:hypothetical protein